MKLTAMYHERAGIMSEELKSCPFCGGENVELSTSIRSQYVQCNECNAFGPDGRDSRQAVCGWNTRSDRMESLEAENARLREALSYIAESEHEDEVEYPANYSWQTYFRYIVTRARDALQEE